MFKDGKKTRRSSASARGPLASITPLWQFTWIPDPRERPEASRRRDGPPAPPPLARYPRRDPRRRLDRRLDLPKPRRPRGGDGDDDPDEAGGCGPARCQFLQRPGLPRRDRCHRPDARSVLRQGRRGEQLEHVRPARAGLLGLARAAIGPDRQAARRRVERRAAASGEALPRLPLGHGRPGHPARRGPARGRRRLRGVPRGCVGLGRAARPQGVARIPSRDERVARIPDDDGPRVAGEIVRDLPRRRPVSPGQSRPDRRRPPTARLRVRRIQRRAPRHWLEAHEKPVRSPARAISMPGPGRSARSRRPSRRSTS